MKNYIRSALDTLTALDFRLDHEDRKLRTDRWIFTHGNSPDERLTLNFKMSEQAARTVVQRARQVVGLATSDSEAKPRPKVSNRDRLERAAETKQREAARSLAEAKYAEREAQRHATAIAGHRRDLDRLMRGKDPAQDAPRAVGIPDHALFTVDQVADMTGATDRAVALAIRNGKLEAYQCGKVVKVKGADVRAWLNGDAA